MSGLHGDDAICYCFDVLKVVNQLLVYRDVGYTIVKVGRLSESPLEYCLLVGHNRLSFLPSCDSLTEKTSSAYSTCLSSATIHMPILGISILLHIAFIYSYHLGISS